MSYIEDKITIKEYLDSIQDKGKKNHIKSILNQFDIFCKQKYEKSNQQVMDDLYEEQKNEDTKNKVYIVFNHFKNWMLIDHPEIVYFMGKKENQRRTIKKRHANTIVTYLKTIRAIFEEIGDIELSSRKFWSKIKVPKPEEDEPEPFTKEQMRLLLDRCSNQSKLKYMTMKDTSMRVSELVQIRKRDTDLSLERIAITIQAKYAKTRRARLAFITKETEPMFRRLLSHKSDDELLFGTNEDVYTAKGSEKALFTYYREELAKDHSEFREIYQSNGRHKKTIHSIRSFTATQCAEAIDEAWGHAYIGHKKYLDQYIRNKDKLLKNFLRSENHLMVYERIEVVDSNEEVKEIRREFEEFRKNTMSYNAILEQISELKAQDAQKEIKIQQLRSLAKN